MFCASRCVYAGSDGCGPLRAAASAEDGAVRTAAVAARASRAAQVGRRMPAQRRCPSRGDGWARSGALEEEDGDLAVGLLLVLRVRRVGRDRALPPLRPLLAL